MNSQESFENFINNVKNSEPSVIAVGEWLHKMGYHIDVPESKYAKSPEELKLYTDDGDLLVDEHRVEVKHLTSYWTCKEDYPYPVFMIGNKEAFERAKRREIMPTVYLIFNKDMTHVVLVSTDFHEDWETMEDVPDYRYDFLEDKYVTSLDRVLWY